MRTEPGTTVAASSPPTPLLRGEGEGRIPGTPYPGLHSFVVHPGLQSYHPYGISVWCDKVASGNAEEVEGIMMVLASQGKAHGLSPMAHHEQCPLYRLWHHMPDCQAKSQSGIFGTVSRGPIETFLGLLAKLLNYATRPRDFVSALHHESVLWQRPAYVKWPRHECDSGSQKMKGRKAWAADHPYGISVWCEEGTEAGEEKVEGL
jgi:hypothetical protein